MARSLSLFIFFEIIAHLIYIFRGRGIGESIGAAKEGDSFLWGVFGVSICSQKKTVTLTGKRKGVSVDCSITLLEG